MAVNLGLSVSIVGSYNRFANLGSTTVPSGSVESTERIQLMSSAEPNTSTTNSLRHHKNVFAVHDGPVATLTIPVAVLVSAPVSIVPIGIGMDHCGAGSGLDCGSGSGVD